MTLQTSHPDHTVILACTSLLLHADDTPHGNLKERYLLIYTKNRQVPSGSCRFLVFTMASSLFSKLAESVWGVKRPSGSGKEDGVPQAVCGKVIRIRAKRRDAAVFG